MLRSASVSAPSRLEDAKAKGGKNGKIRRMGVGNERKETLTLQTSAVSVGRVNAKS